MYLSDLNNSAISSRMLVIFHNFTNKFAERLQFSCRCVLKLDQIVWEFHRMSRKFSKYCESEENHWFILNLHAAAKIILCSVCVSFLFKYTLFWFLSLTFTDRPPPSAGEQRARTAASATGFTSASRPAAACAAGFVNQAPSAFCADGAFFLLDIGKMLYDNCAWSSVTVVQYQQDEAG